MSESSSLDLSTALPCHQCGYDLRAQPSDGNCPECGTSVEESRKMQAIPVRPKWRDADPRWRRRMIAGAWVLMLVPLMAVIENNQWQDEIYVPTFSAVQGEQSLRNCFVRIAYVHLVFCIGAVLLFSRERDRRPARLDRLRPWGVAASYGVFLLGVVNVGFIVALVTLGIAAMFQSMWPPTQPAITGFLVKISTTYLLYAPVPGKISLAALTGFSSIVVLLACVPLFNALRSNGPRVLAMILLAPLALSAVVQLGYAVLYAVGSSAATPQYVYSVSFFFDPQALAESFATLDWSSLGSKAGIEIAKWCACLGIAVWLTLVQTAAIVGATKASLRNRRRVAA